MLKVDGRAFAATVSVLQRIQVDIKSQTDQVPAWGTAGVPELMKSSLIGCLDLLLAAIDPLGLKMATREIHRLKAAVGDVDTSVTDVRYWVEALESRVLDELEGVLLYCVDSRNGHLMMQPDPFGPEISTSFPDARYDMEEAAKCLALRRATACVFHLMRVMEITLKNLCGKLGISDLEREWGKLLSSMDVAIKSMGKGQEADDWSEIRANLYHVKQAWRNHTMHPNVNYTEEQAEEIFRAIVAFLDRLRLKA